MKQRSINSGVLAFIAFIFSYFFSLMNNTWQTSLFRAVIGFFLFFIISFCVFVILEKMIYRKVEVSKSSTEEKMSETTKIKQTDEQLGQITQNKEDDFQSIPLQALHTGEQLEPSEEAVLQATRSWMKENRGDSR